MANILAVTLKRASAGLALALLAPALSACHDDAAGATQRPAFVRTEIVRPRVRQTSVTLTGEVQARFRADLAFRVSGRVVERLVEAGAHVDAGQVLARLDPAEQKADVDAATAAAAASQSQLRVATATFERQKALLSNGFTTRVVFDQAQEGLQSADASLQDAKAQLGRAKEALGDTELRASAAGVITERKLEIGQVVDAGQSAFTLAQDGDRDAIFDVDERILARRRRTRRNSAEAPLGSECHSARTHQGDIAGSRYEKLYGACQGRNSKSAACHDAWKRCSRHRQI